MSQHTSITPATLSGSTVQTCHQPASPRAQKAPKSGPGISASGLCSMCSTLARVRSAKQGA